MVADAAPADEPEAAESTPESPERLSDRIDVTTVDPDTVEDHRHLTPPANRADQPRMIQARERDLTVLELKKHGATFQTIADALHLAGPSSAFRIWQRAQRQAITEEATEVTNLELSRLDEIWGPMYEQALTGNRLAVDRCILIAELEAQETARILADELAADMVDAIEVDPLTGEIADE
jgi:hypothetical protein